MAGGAPTLGNVLGVGLADGVAAANLLQTGILLGTDAAAAGERVAGASWLAGAIVAAEAVETDGVRSAADSGAVVDVELALGAGVAVVSGRAHASRAMEL